MKRFLITEHDFVLKKKKIITRINMFHAYKKNCYHKKYS